MSTFFDRLRAALAPEYELLRELGSGGMGTVYLARDVALDGWVAVKALRPELWTSESAKQFVDEARILRWLRHPNIVPVHKVDEKQGVNFYVMDYLGGDTVQSRLEKQGPMPVDAARNLARDLLEALEVAHRKGVIHRDVKPANLFLDEGRGVLTDFGIARRLTADERTDPLIQRGTAAYMAPEQFAGVEADALTDLYAAAMVIYETLTGRRWDKVPPRDGDWGGVPWNIARVLRRALALDRDRRWPDAAAFRRRLWRTRVWPYVRNTIGVALGCTVLGMAVVFLWPERSTALQLRVEAASSQPPLPPWLGDSVACRLARQLDRYPELSVGCTSGFARFWRQGLRLRPDIEYDGGQARIRLVSALPTLDTIVVRGPPEQWARLADSLADGVFGALLGTPQLLDRSLPAAVLPKTRDGRRAFQEAERLFTQARWSEARAAYAGAGALDSTCWLCYWRHAEVGRWFDLQDDPRDSARYLAHIDAFPDYYRSLIRAQQLPEAARLDSLDALARRWKDFVFGQFRRGDELLHRGPLVGRSRREAMAPFQDVLRLQPAFGPALEHVAWVHIAEGDAADATVALAGVDRLGVPSDPVAFAPLALVRLAFVWRFSPRVEAERRTDELVRAARAAGFVQLDAGARYLSGFGAPQGGLAFAERLLRQPGFERSAGLARVLALVSLGRPDTAVVLARRLADRFPELAIFAEELAATTLLFDVDSARFAAGWPAVHDALAEQAEQRMGPGDRRRRAAWMLGIVEHARGRAADPAWTTRLAGEPPPRPLAVLLLAAALAARGGQGAALAVTDGLAAVPAQQTDDPFFRTVLHLSRADWYERGGHRAGARPELLWHENSDLSGYPTGDPQPAEVDWAFAGLAQWRLAILTERWGGRVEDVCRSYGVVTRLWSEGEPRFRARADSAARRVQLLHCEAP